MCLCHVYCQSKSINTARLAEIIVGQDAAVTPLDSLNHCAAVDGQLVES